MQQLAQKEYKTGQDWVGEVFHKEMYKKFKFDHTNKWYMHNPVAFSGEWHTQTPMELWHTNGSPNLGQKTKPYSNQKKKKIQNCRLCYTGWPQNKTERKWKEA